MKKANLFIIIPSSIIVFILIILLNVKILVSDGNFYHNEFEKHNVYETLGGYDVNAVHNDTLGFILMKKNFPPESFFSDREIKHLNDVRKISNIANFLLFLSVLIICLYAASLYCIFWDVKKLFFYLGSSVLIGALIVLVFSLVLIIIAKLDFSLGFEKFHSIFFEEGSYLFEPATEKIVLLYPEGLFLDAGIRIAINSALSSMILVFFGFLLIKLAKIK